MKQKIVKLLGYHNPILLMFYKLKAVLANLLYFYPSRKLKVIGVTGTDGKTTTVNLIADMLKAAGYKVGVTSTLRYAIGDEVWSNRDKMTTQSPFFLQKMLRKMVAAKCDYAIVEVTSHAVVQYRIWGVNFDVAVLTNLGADHLEYHGSFDHYMVSKGRFIGSLFGSKRKIGSRKTVILNADDEHFEYFDQFQGDLKFAYGINNGSVLANDVVLRADGAEFVLKIPNANESFKINLIGEFNLYNCLAVICVAISQGIPLGRIVEIMSKLQPIPGRLESVNMGQDFAVVVDYAHTADALLKVCKVFKGLAKRLILVFGATGGGRDKSKRPDMGKIADKMADLIVLTDDDPYTEDRVQIIEQIASGIDRVEGDRLYKIVDRALAIEFALKQAQPGDIVLITGKGGEEVIVIDDEIIPYDDREVVKKVLSEMLFNDMNIDA